MLCGAYRAWTQVCEDEKRAAPLASVYRALKGMRSAVDAREYACKAAERRADEKFSRAVFAIWREAATAEMQERRRCSKLEARADALSLVINNNLCREVVCAWRGEARWGRAVVFNEALEAMKGHEACWRVIELWRERAAWWSEAGYLSSWRCPVKLAALSALQVKSERRSLQGAMSVFRGAVHPGIGAEAFVDQNGWNLVGDCCGDAPPESRFNACLSPRMSSQTAAGGCSQQTGPMQASPSKSEVRAGEQGEDEKRGVGKEEISGIRCKHEEDVGECDQEECYDDDYDDDEEEEEEGEGEEEELLPRTATSITPHPPPPASSIPFSASTFADPAELQDDTANPLADRKDRVGEECGIDVAYGGMGWMRRVWEGLDDGVRDEVYTLRQGQLLAQHAASFKDPSSKPPPLSLPRVPTATPGGGVRLTEILPTPSPSARGKNGSDSQRSHADTAEKPKHSPFLKKMDDSGRDEDGDVDGRMRRVGEEGSDGFDDVRDLLKERAQRMREARAARTAVGRKENGGDDDDDDDDGDDDKGIEVRVSAKVDVQGKGVVKHASIAALMELMQTKELGKCAPNSKTGVGGSSISHSVGSNKRNDKDKVKDKDSKKDKAEFDVASAARRSLVGKLSQVCGEEIEGSRKKMSTREPVAGKDSAGCNMVSGRGGLGLVGTAVGAESFLPPGRSSMPSMNGWRGTLQRPHEEQRRAGQVHFTKAEIVEESGAIAQRAVECARGDTDITTVHREARSNAESNTTRTFEDKGSGTLTRALVGTGWTVGGTRDESVHAAGVPRNPSSVHLTWVDSPCEFDFALLEQNSCGSARFVNQIKVIPEHKGQV